MNKRLKKKIRRRENKKLIEEYPFLYPKDWRGRPVNKKRYKYDRTFLDDMPVGWKKRFGKQMCADIKAVLIEDGCLETYGLSQVKEKWGILSWYDYGGSKKAREIIMKYGHISKYTCTECGKLNVPILDGGWVLPLCKGCWGETTFKRMKYYKTPPTYESQIAGEADLQETFTIRRWNSDKDDLEEIEYHCGDILERISR